jgi:hypothetical protein
MTAVFPSHPMKPTPSHLKAILLTLFSVLTAPISHGEVSQASTASTAAISIDRSEYFNQTSASAAVHQTMPFSLNFNIRGASQDTTAWGPAFFKPGSGGVPQSGSSSATNTGTLNFSAAPNNGPHDYMFVHDFATDADLLATYPLGAYGVKFLGSGKPTIPRTDNPFTAGLAFATSGATYPSATPQITSANNGATWSSGALQISPTGVTTLTLSAFPEYNSSTYGSVITAGIYNVANGNVVAPASVEAYYLPTLGVNQPAVTQLTLDGAWLTPGVTYILQIQYVIIASAPVEGYLDNVNYQGVASYMKNTSIAVTVGGTPPPPTADANWLVRAATDFDGNGTPDILRENVATGERTLWLMNGTSPIGTVTIGTDADTNWHMVGAGDFNGDGKQDILWQNLATGARRVWLMNRTTFVSSVDLGTDADTNWRIVGAADFDRDGKPDIIWQNISTGERKVWIMNGTTFSRSIGWSSDPDTRWRVCGAGDYDGNGTVDLLWQNIVTGERAIWQMNGTAFVHNVGLSADPDVRWRVLGTGDYSGHGSQDILWENIETGQVVVWIMNGTSYTGVANLNF